MKTLDDFLTETVSTKTKKPTEPTPKAPSRWQWVVDETQKTVEDFTPYIKKNAVVSLEMELDYKRGLGGRGAFDPIMKEVLGAGRSSMCPVCGSRQYDCGCDLPTTIRFVTTDCTIQGKEIQVWGLPITSEEFAKRLPLANIRQWFSPTKRDSMHTHTLIPKQDREIPMVIAQDAWQFFKAYYPAWVHIFGNYRGRFLRSHWAKWDGFATDALDWSWWPKAARKFDGGLHFQSCEISNSWQDNYGHRQATKESTITSLDAEIRTQDASVDLDQIVSARALSKVVFVEAAKLANQGVVTMAQDRKDVIEPVIRVLNDAWHQEYSPSNRPIEVYDTTLETTHGAFMRALALEFFDVVKDSLTEFERKCVLNCIEKPVRLRKRA